MIEDEFTTEEYEVQAEEGSTLLKACKQSNIPIHCIGHLSYNDF